MTKVLDRIDEYNCAIDYSKWNALNIHLYDAVKMFKRNNKFKYLKYINDLLTYSEEFKEHIFYEDLAKKYNICNIMGKYILRTLRHQRKYFPLDFHSVCNHRTYNGKTIAELFKIHVGFDVMLDLGEKDHPVNNEGKGVGDLVKILAEWRSFMGGNNA
jgi:hypothetical protein